AGITPEQRHRRSFAFHRRFPPQHSVLRGDFFMPQPQNTHFIAVSGQKHSIKEALKVVRTFFSGMFFPECRRMMVQDAAAKPTLHRTRPARVMKGEPLWNRTSI
ncbi:MAG: hypothetical protein IJ484_07080, partial [Oscillospiraceae bacterium]|nr:hypothetical protein [Oscillospiraceae bacterium]